VKEDFVLKRHKDLKSGWYIGAGEKKHNGALVEPHLDIGKIPQAAWLVVQA
jgi:hypothetical protein